MDAIRLFPMVRPSGYPDKTDATERRIEKHHEEYRALLEQKKVQDKIADIVYFKNSEFGDCFATISFHEQSIRIYEV